jgi:hypothetical protein
MPSRVVKRLCHGCSMFGTALPQSARPEGIPSPNDTRTLPNRDAMNANTLGRTLKFQTGSLIVRPRFWRSPIRAAVGEPNHHDDKIRSIRCEAVTRHLRPIVGVAGLAREQPGEGTDANDADLMSDRVRSFELRSILQPT